MPTVLVLDDHELVRRGIVSVLDATEDFAVVAEAATARQARAHPAATRPELAVVDQRLPDGDGAAVCRAVAEVSPATRCIVISSVGDEAARAAAREAGAAAFVLKGTTARDLLEVLRAVAAGRVLHETLAPAVAQPEAVHLTPRERQLLSLIEQGRSNREIAVELRLADKTVKNYVTALLRTLGVRSRTQAAVLAVHRRLG